MEHKRKKLSGSANRKLKEEKEARQKAFLEKMPTLTNFFKKGETLSMDITQGEQHKEGKEKNQQQYDNNAQQSNVKEKEEDQTQQQEDQAQQQEDQAQQNLQQPQPEDQEREYLDEDELSNMLSVNYADPALWGRLSEDKIIDIMKNISNVEVDIQKLDFTASKVVYKSQSRYATKMIFYRHLLNGKQQKRNWLLYSNTSGKVYCIPCKLFGSANNPFSAGFNDWKHSEKISDHENSALHKENTRILVNRSTEKWEYFKNYSIISMEKNTNYWKNILERIVEVIKFLSSRGLAFRGENQTIGDKHNGNYLGCLELEETRKI